MVNCSVLSANAQYSTPTHRGVNPLLQIGDRSIHDGPNTFLAKGYIEVCALFDVRFECNVAALLDLDLLEFKVGAAV